MVWISNIRNTYIYICIYIYNYIIHIHNIYMLYYISLPRHTIRISNFGLEEHASEAGQKCSRGRLAIIAVVLRDG